MKSSTQPLEEIIINNLKATGKPVIKTGQDWITTTCLNPTHEDKHPSFAINTTSGTGKCFSCGFKVNKNYWLGEGLDEDTLNDIARSVKYSNLLSEYTNKDLEVSAKLYMPPKDEKVPDWWRGVSPYTINRLGMYICRTGIYKDRVIFPMWDTKGYIIGFNSRALGNQEPKYKYSKGIKVNEIAYPPLDRTEWANYVVIVEGILDAILMQQDGIPAIFNFGVQNTLGPKKIAYLLRNGVDKIYIALDKDKAGYLGTAKYLEDKTLRDFFDVRLGTELPELQDFYKSDFKDYADYCTKDIKKGNKDV